MNDAASPLLPTPIATRLTPLAGLRRLAALAEPESARGPDHQRPPTPTPPAAPAVMSDAHLAARVNAVLQREARRHGIDLEGP